MTDIFFFDTDCLSAFLWVKGESILSKLYSGKIIVPQQVYDELSSPYTPQLKQRLDDMLINGEVEIRSIQTDSEAYTLYYQMTQNPENGYKIIGSGEASCIAFAMVQGGIVASNNLKDIDYYIKKYSITHITTGGIMVEAYNRGLITESEGNSIWADMLRKKRKLGELTFSDYLNKNNSL